MSITKVEIYPLKTEHKTIAANAIIIIDNKYKVRCTVRKGSKGLWVGLPGRYGEKPGEDGNKPWYNDVDCISKEARQELNDAVLGAYRSKQNGTPSSQGEAEGPTDQTKQNIPFG